MSTPIIPEQLVTAQKAGLEALFVLTTKALGTIEELAELNWQAVKTTLEENQELLTKAFSAKQPQDLLSLPMATAQPAVDKAVSYSRQVAEIISKAQQDFSATAAALAQQYQRNTQALLESFGKNMPAGTEAAMTAWKSAISLASVPSETAKKPAKQAAQSEAAAK